MIRKCAKFRDIKVKAIHVSVSFDLTQLFLEIHRLGLGLKIALNVKFYIIRMVCLWSVRIKDYRIKFMIKHAANPIFSISGNSLNTTLNTIPNQLGYKIYSMWFITSEPMPRASWGKHVLWMSSSEYLMNWWVTVWSLAEAGPNIIWECWQSPEGNTSVCLL